MFDVDANHRVPVSFYAVVKNEMIISVLGRILR